MMTPKQKAAMQMALEALKFAYYEDKDYNDDCQQKVNKAREKLREALAEQPAQQQEPVAFSPVQFEKVAEGVEVGYDFLGGVDIRLGGEFVYVHINYDYRYTHNAARKALADQIVGLITTQPAQQQEPVCDKDPQGCWSVRCQLGNVCKNTSPPASKPEDK